MINSNALDEVVDASVVTEPLYLGAISMRIQSALEGVKIGQYGDFERRAFRDADELLLNRVYSAARFLYSSSMANFSENDIIAYEFFVRAMGQDKSKEPTKAEVMEKIEEIRAKFVELKAGRPTNVDSLIDLFHNFTQETLSG